MRLIQYDSKKRLASLFFTTPVKKTGILWGNKAWRLYAALFLAWCFFFVEIVREKLCKVLTKNDKRLMMIMKVIFIQLVVFDQLGL